MSYPGCSFSEVLSRLSCCGCPGWLSCPSWPGPATMTTAILKSLSFICYHVLAPALSLWSRLTCPGWPVRSTCRYWPVPTVLSYWPCPTGPVLLVLPQPSCHGCPIPVVLCSCPSPVLAVMFWLFRSLFLILNVLSQLSFPAVLSQLSFPSCPVPAPAVLVLYHCGGWSEEVNSCISITYTVYL